jgi:branched-chain amino acid transport system substrate-binding protein
MQLRLNIRHIVRRGFLVSLSALLSLAGAASAQSSDQLQKRSSLIAESSNAKSQPIKIGFLAELSGVASDPGHDLLNGMQLFMDQINGTIAGRKVQLIVENDESSAPTGVAKAKKLIDEDKVDVLSGLILANVAYAVAPVADRTKTPFVISVAAADDLTQRKRSEWVVRAGFSCSSHSFPLGEYAAKELHYKKVVTLGMDYPFGYETVGGFQKSFELAGGKVIQKLWAPLGFQDFTEQIKKIRPDADALFLNSTSKAAEIIPKQLKEQGIKLPIIACGTSFDESILPHLGDEAVGALSTANYSAALDTAANKKFVQAFRAKYHQDPGLYAVGAYNSGLMIKKALESLKGDTSDKQKLMQAIRHVELTETPGGHFKLDDYGNPVQNMYLRRVDKKNGKLQNTIVHTFPNVTQFWTWTPEEYMKQPPYSAAYPPCTNCIDKQ